MPIDRTSPPRFSPYSPTSPYAQSSGHPQPSGYSHPGVGPSSPRTPYAQQAPSAYSPMPSMPSASFGGLEPRRSSPPTSSHAPRTRALHHLSDGESDSENPNVLYRSLRRDEDPRRGLRPPEGYDPNLTASQHITAGSRAKTKSEFVSATRSAKVASAWASEGGPGGRVARFNKPLDRESYDLTNPYEAARVFPTGKGSSLNTAKASQEVVIRGGVPPENITGVWDAHRVPMSQYAEASADTVPGFERKSRSRSKATNTPHPVVLTEWVPPRR